MDSSKNLHPKFLKKIRFNKQKCISTIYYRLGISHFANICNKHKNLFDIFYNCVREQVWKKNHQSD